VSMKASADASHREPFRVEIQREREIVRVVLIGELDLATIGELSGHLQELRDAGVERLVLDLRRLEFIDSSGLHLILELDRDARSDGHEFAVTPGPPAIERLFKLTGIDQHVHVQRHPNVNRQEDTPTALAAQRGAAREQHQLQRDTAELSGQQRRLRACVAPAAPRDHRDEQRGAADDSSSMIHTESVLDLDRNRQEPAA